MFCANEQNSRPSRTPTTVALVMTQQNASTEFIQGGAVHHFQVERSSYPERSHLVQRLPKADHRRTAQPRQECCRRFSTPIG